MNLMNLIEGRYVLMEEAADGDAGGAAPGGSIISDAGADVQDSGAEGSAKPEDGDAGKEGDVASGAEGKAAADAEAGKDGEGEAEESEGAPETYDDFVIPEGMVAAPEALAEFQEFAKARNLSQKDAQEVLDYHSKEVSKLFAAQEQQWQAVQEGWVKEAKADSEYGGVKFQENMKYVAAAVKQFGGDKLRDTLNQTGLGNHPELVRYFYNVGKAISESNIRTGNGGDAGDKDAASVLYPDMK